MHLSTQCDLVTGAGRGLATHIASAFASQGARVIINYRRSEAAAIALATELGDTAMTLQADVTDPAQVSRMLAQAQIHFGQPLTILVNNARTDLRFNGNAREQAGTIGWSAISTQSEGSVRAALNTTQAALPGMREAGGGRIINIGTSLFQNPVVPYHDYTATKAALLSLTRTLAGDLGPDGITVNMLSGGLLRTTDASAATPEAVFDYIAANTPLRSVPPRPSLPMPSCSSLARDRAQ